MVCLVHQLERGPVLLEHDPGWQPASYGVDLRGVQREKVVSRETCEVHLYSTVDERVNNVMTYTRASAAEYLTRNCSIGLVSCTADGTTERLQLVSLSIQ